MGCYLLGSVVFRLVLFTIAKRVVDACEKVLSWACVVPKEDFVSVDSGERF